MSTARPLLASLLLTAVAGCSHSRAPKPDLTAAKVNTIGVNGYLWRASLETLSFLPVAKVDSAGGVIVTDWYTNPQSANERIKVTVSILDAALRADALQVAVSRQQQSSLGWVDVPVRAGTQQKLEETILQRARDIRRQTIGE